MKTTVQSNQKKPASDGKKPKKYLGAKVFITIVFLILAMISPWGLALAYKGRVYPNVRVGDHNLGSLTPDEAKQKIASLQNDLNSQGPTFIYDGQKITATLTELGVSFDGQKAFEDAYNFGRSGSISQKAQDYFQLFSQGHRANLDIQIDQQKLNTFLDGLIKKVAQEPVNAMVKVENGEVYFISAKDGFGLDKEKLNKQIISLINRGDLSAEIKLEMVKQKAQVQDDQAQEALQQTTKYLASDPIQVQYNDNIFTADKVEIGRWMFYQAKNNELTVYVDPTSFIKAIGKKVEIAARDREIDQNGSLVFEGRDGLGIDPTILANQIRSNLDGKSQGVIALPVFDIPHGEKTTYGGGVPGRVEGRYIDVDLSEQKIFAFEGSTLVKSFLISSGTYLHPTPTGEFNVYGKSRSTLMDGPDYYLPGVQWVTWWHGDYSIHGTYWHHNFGHPMSHGCLNATNADAEFIYNWSSIGTPVFVHQ